jgi:hypothetical protein
MRSAGIAALAGQRDAAKTRDAANVAVCATRTWKRAVSGTLRRFSTPSGSDRAGSHNQRAADVAFFYTVRE